MFPYRPPYLFPYGQPIGPYASQPPIQAAAQPVPAQPPAQAETPVDAASRSVHVVVALDYDGCANHALPLSPQSELYFHEPLRKLIQGYAQQENVTQVDGHYFSGRSHSPVIEAAGRKLYKNPACSYGQTEILWQLFIKEAKNILSETQSSKFGNMDHALFHDVLTDREYGATWEACMLSDETLLKIFANTPRREITPELLARSIREFDPNRPLTPEEWLTGVFLKADNQKIALTLFTAWYAHAKRKPGHHLKLVIVDDTLPILNAIHWYYSQSKGLLPPDLTLELHRYETWGDHRDLGLSITTDLNNNRGVSLTARQLRHAATVLTDELIPNRTVNVPLSRVLPTPPQTTATVLTAYPGASTASSAGANSGVHTRPFYP